MFRRNSILLALALSVTATASVACGDHRNEDFCTTICECQSNGEDEVTACTSSCTSQLDSAEESAGRTLVSDECFSCVINSSCERVQFECASACQSLQDVGDSPQPTPDPRPGVQ